MAKNAVTDWSTSAASNTDVGGIGIQGSSNISSGDNSFREIMAQIATQLGKLNAKGADLASGSTVDLSTATGAFVHITGTTTITALGTVTAGRVFRLEFDGALTLTHNGTSLILPGAANITTAAGDTAEFISEGGGNWRCMRFTRADGKSLVGISALVPQGRLTLTTALPVTTADVTAAGTVYYTPTVGDQLPIYDGTNLVSTTFAELSLALNSNSGHTGYHQSGKGFDCFVFNDSGTIRLGTGPAWSSDTSRGSGAGTTELERYKGLLVNKVSITLRFGTSSGDTVAVAASKATYVGSFYCTANGQTEDSAANRLVSNAYNRVDRHVNNIFTTSRSTSSTSLVEVNSEIRIRYLDGTAQDAVDLHFEASATVSSAGTRFGFGISIDGTATSRPTTELIPDGTGAYHTSTRRTAPPSLGLHTASVMAIVSAATGGFRTGATATAFPTLNGIVRS